MRDGMKDLSPAELAEVERICKAYGVGKLDTDRPGSEILGALRELEKKAAKY